MSTVVLLCVGTNHLIMHTLLHNMCTQTCSLSPFVKSCSLPDRFSKHRLNSILLAGEFCYATLVYDFLCLIILLVRKSKIEWFDIHYCPIRCLSKSLFVCQSMRVFGFFRMRVSIRILYCLTSVQMFIENMRSTSYSIRKLYFMFYTWQYLYIRKFEYHAIFVLLLLLTFENLCTTCTLDIPYT